MKARGLDIAVREGDHRAEIKTEQLKIWTNIRALVLHPPNIRALVLHPPNIRALVRQSEDMPVSSPSPLRLF